MEIAQTQSHGSDSVIHVLPQLSDFSYGFVYDPEEQLQLISALAQALGIIFGLPR